DKEKSTADAYAPGSELDQVYGLLLANVLPAVTGVACEVGDWLLTVAVGLEQDLHALIPLHLAEQEPAAGAHELVHLLGDRALTEAGRGSHHQVDVVGMSPELLDVFCRDAIDSEPDEVVEG